MSNTVVDCQLLRSSVSHSIIFEISNIYYCYNRFISRCAFVVTMWSCEFAFVNEKKKWCPNKTTTTTNYHNNNDNNNMQATLLVCFLFMSSLWCHLAHGYSPCGNTGESYAYYNDVTEYQGMVATRTLPLTQLLFANSSV